MLKRQNGVLKLPGNVLDLAESQPGRDPLLEAKRKLALVYLGMAKDQFTDADAEIFSVIAKKRALQDELAGAQKNN